MFTKLYLLVSSGLLLLGFPALIACIRGQDVLPGKPWRLMWYNTENFFHPADDPFQGDDDFTPAGARGWTTGRYRDKCTKVAKVILAAGSWGPPDAAGLCEIENERVLKDLVSHPILEPWDLKYVHHESPDHRGMDVAFLYREEAFRLYGWKCYPSPETGDSISTREILHIWGSIHGSRDTSDIFLLHFISRYRGSAASAGFRIAQSGQLAALLDSVAGARDKPLIIVAGDFNEEAAGFTLAPLHQAMPGGDSLKFVDTGPRKSYKYHGRWEAIDGFMVISGNERIKYSGSVLWHPSLMERDEPYGGLRPFRTYRGYKYTGGFSDHLPLILDLSHPLFSGAAER